jgi:ferredoxin
MDSVQICCFSGTGNTLLVARAMRDEFSRRGINASLFLMEKVAPSSLNLRGTIGLAFPVAIFTTYPMVWEFVKSMPVANGTEVFMVDTLGGFSAGIMAPMKKILEGKGYTPIGCAEIQMPLNLISHEEGSKSRMIEKGELEATEYAGRLTEGRAQWRSYSCLSELARLLLSNGLVWWLAKQYPRMRVEEALCSRCRICSKICPAGNISMSDYPIHGSNCQVCMRCYAYCPQEAIHYSRLFKRYRAAKVSDFM